MDLFIYDWSIDNDKYRTNIRIWGLNKKNESICLCVNDFTPFVYLELPIQYNWKSELYQELLYKRIDDICGWKNYRPLHKEICYKKKLFYANVDSENNYKLYPFILLAFNSTKHINNLRFKLKNMGNIISLEKDITNMKVNMHEYTANPILQLTCFRNIPTAGWIKFKGKKISEDDCETYCNHEYNVGWKKLYPNNTIDIIPQPYMLSFDIEVNSHNINKFPTGEHKDDKIFQISCIFNRQGDTNYSNYLLTLGTPDSIKDTTILTYKTELELILGFRDIILEKNPQIIIGYNILSFDIQYIINRAQGSYCNCLEEFSTISCLKDIKSPVKKIKWSSSAYRNQEFEYLETPGRLFIDLLPIVRRDYKFNNYTLKLVSTFFLGETKDPLDHKDIFRGYRLGMNCDEKGNKALGMVGKYCVQDSVLVTKLFEKLQCWVGLCEMAKTCNVPIIYTYTHGQQIKVYSQVYKLCMHTNFVVENDAYIPNENEEYTGATVFPPNPGLYEKVIPFDFASLYPTTIIAYNIDYSTLVTDDSIPDDKTHIIEWEDHIGCEHDTTIRNTGVNKVICAKRKYRFLKEPKGVMPSLLEKLLDTRKQTKTQMKNIKNEIKTNKNLSEQEINDMKKKCIVLDKRQLAYKVSANSMYGSMGVKKGYLPFLPGAMCTTARGRQSIEKAASIIKGYHNGELIYGDTDSCYIHFPNLKTSEECWDYALDVENSVSELFPKPMKLEFEEAIYWRFFILSKKRYMAVSCGRDGVLDDNIEKKGVLLARRDNSKFIRDFYEKLIMMIFDKKEENHTLLFIIDYLNDLCSGKFGYKEFIITKLIGDKEDYKIRPLPDDMKKRMKRLKDLGIYMHASDKDYIDHNIHNCDICKKEGKLYTIKSLPAHIQLAEKMIERGRNVEVGSRLEYIVSVGEGHQSKQFDKLEDPKYQQEHNDIIKIDYLHYLKTSCPPIDQLLEVRYKLTKFMDKQYKIRLQKYNQILELKELFNCKLKFI
jgi:DNA polymerase elongation subunit (family B)